jgi:hypothetical protein
MQPEQGVAPGALVIHPCLRIVPVVLPQPQELDAVLVALHDVFLEASDNEFSLLYKVE